MTARRLYRAVRTCVAGASLALAAPTHAQLNPQQLPDELQGVGVDADKRGTAVPREILLWDAEGREVRTSEWFDGRRPVMLVMAYYDCPLLCTLMLNNVQSVLNELDWVAGNEYRAVVVSFDHTNTTADAKTKQSTYHLGYAHADEMTEDGWTFYTTTAPDARRLASAVGFHYRYLPDTGEFAHSSALFFLTPDGHHHNFIEQLKPRARNVKLALIEASDGATASIFERAFAACWYQDPNTGEWAANAMTIMKFGAGGVGLLTLTGLALAFGVWEVRRRRATPGM